MKQKSAFFDKHAGAELAARLSEMIQRTLMEYRPNRGDNLLGWTTFIGLAETEIAVIKAQLPQWVGEDK